MIYNIKELFPLHDYVIIKRVETNKTPGGVIVPHTEEEPNLAKVMALGPGKPGIPGCDIAADGYLKVGDYVLVAKFIGTIARLDNQDCVMIKYYDVQCKVLFEDGKGPE